MDLIAELQRNAAAKFTTYDDAGGVAEYRFDGIRSDVLRLAEALSSAGVTERSSVALVGTSNYFWIAADLALRHLDAVSICPPDEQLSAAQFARLIDRYSVSVVLISDDVTSARLADIRGTVLVKDILHGVAVEVITRPQLALDSDVFTIAFSSGTSGDLKSLMITKSGIEHTISVSSRMWQIGRGDNILIALPFSSMQNRTLAYNAICVGCSVSLTAPNRLVWAYRDFEPTILVGPPAFYQYLSDRFAAEPFALRAAVICVCYLADRGLPCATARRWKAQAFPDIFRYFGPRMRLMLVGSAPCPQALLRTYRHLGMPLYQVYGITEFGWVAFNLPHDNSIGSVGRPLPDVTFRFTENREIVVSGPHPQARGYFDAPAEVARSTFVAPGTVATGDCGHLSRAGFLHLDGRTKNIIISRGGAKVNAEQIEREIESISAVRVAVVTQVGHTGSILAVVRCNQDPTTTGAEAIRAQVRQILDAHRLDSASARLEIDAVASDWSEMMTRNFKIDRRAIAAHFGMDRR